MAGLVAFVAVALVTGWLGSIPTSAALESWYPSLIKPSFTPPAVVFPIVWSVLYVVMGVAAWLAWIAPGSVARNTVLALFFIQLALNASWSWAFFGLQDPMLALFVIVALDAAVLWMTLAARRVNRAAAFLFLPYLAWIAFATALNAAITFMNQS